METERLVLRRYAEKDKADLIRLFTDAAVMKHVGDGVLTRTQAEDWWRKLFEKFYPQNVHIWAVFEKENSQYVGHAGIYPRPTKPEDWEFVYFLNQNNWGKGYATEIARRLIEFAFEDLKLPQVSATVDDDHAASIRILEKCGMKFKRYEFDESGRFSVYFCKKLSYQSWKTSKVQSCL